MRACRRPVGIPSVGWTAAGFGGEAASVPGHSSESRRCSSSWRWTGFVRHPSKPSMGSSSASPGRVSGVTMTILVKSNLWSERMAAHSSLPSIPGISLSTRAMSKEWLRKKAASSSCKADVPSATAIGSIPRAWVWSESCSLVVGLPTAIRMRRWWSSWGLSKRLGVAFGCRAKRAVNQNVEPFPSRLSTPMSPPINAASCFEMARPSPVPPYLRLVDESTWVNFSNRIPSLSSGIPIPVSLTENLSRTSLRVCSHRAAVTATSPVAVNLMALPARLVRTWFSLQGSPTRSTGTSEAMAQFHSSPLALARKARESANSSIFPARSNPTASRVNFPDSILE